MPLLVANRVEDRLIDSRPGTAIVFSGLLPMTVRRQPAAGRINQQSGGAG